MASRSAVLGVLVTYSSEKEILKYIEDYMNFPSAEEPLLIVTPNVEQIEYAYTNKHFFSILNDSASVALPDGAGVVWGFRQYYPNIHIKRITGTDFCQKLVSIYGDNYTFALLGGYGKSARTALNHIKTSAKHHGWADSLITFNVQGETIKAVGVETDEYIDQLAKKIKDSRTRFVFIGLGVPKQEYLMEELRKRLAEYKVVLMAVGGAFDYISGQKKRAPKLLQETGLEWLWRLVSEPWRIRRQLALPMFVWHIFKHKHLHMLK